MAMLTISQTSTMLLLVAFLAVTPTTIEALCSDAILTSLSSTGFTVFAQALHSHNLPAAATTTTTTLTCFVPPDTAFLGQPVTANTLHSHIYTAGALPFHALIELPANTTFLTLHRNTTLAFGSDGKRVSFNHVLVVAPNLHVDDSCVVHGVEGPLVPIPSSMDDHDHDHHPSPRIKTVVPKHRGRRFAEFVRFIRRAHRPVLVDRDQDTNLP